MSRVAVIGLGKMGLLHASLLNIIPDVRLVAICEKSRLINRFSKNIIPNVKIISEVNDLAGLQLDAVYITTPTSTHCGIINAIIKHEICQNIFVEKPLADNAKKSIQICAMINESGNVGNCMVGYNRRFNVTFRKAKKIIEDGILGEPVTFEGYAFSSDFLGVTRGGKGANRGGVLRDLGCHAIDLASWFFGGIELKSINSSKVSADNSLDSINMAVSTDKKVEGQIKTSWCEPNYRLPEIGLIIEGTTGHTLIANDDKVELKNNKGMVETWHKQDLNDNVHFMLGGTDYYREDEEYTNAVKAVTQIEPTFSTALKVDEFISSAEKLLARQSDNG